VPAKLEVDCIIGADGANSRVAKEIDAGDYDYAIAFQVRPPAPYPGATQRGAAARSCSEELQRGAAANNAC
jgi:flavin-dependent dehydrogenase